MINHETMVADVLVYMQESNGRKFTSAELAKTFKVSCAGMNIIIAKLGSKIELIMQSGKKRYFTPSDELVAERARVAGLPRRTHAKPLDMSKDPRWAIMLDRVKEVYPLGAGFISIS
jgi:hypothetical protein